MFSKSIKNVFEDTHVAPSDKSVIEHFIGAVFFWNIFPLQTELSTWMLPLKTLFINFLLSPRVRKERANSVHSREKER